MSERIPRREILALLLLVAVALALRLYRLEAQSFWNDEGTSVALALRDLPTITRNAASDIHPPLYYYLLHGWLRLYQQAGAVGGNLITPVLSGEAAPLNEAAARSLSVLIGAAVVATTYLLARRPFGSLTAFLAGLLVAISPFQVYYAQEARMYILVTLFGALSMLAYAQLLNALVWPANGRRVGLWASLYFVTTVLAVYSHYFAFTLLAAQNIGFLVWLAWPRRVVGLSPSPLGRGGSEGLPSLPSGQGKGEGRRTLWGSLLLWGGLQLAVGLAYVPWLALSWHSLRNWPAVSAPLSLLGMLRAVAQAFTVGLTLEPRQPATLLGLALSVLVLPGLISNSIYRRERTGVGRDGAQTDAWDIVSTALYLAVPVLAMYVLSLQRPMYKPKFLLLATPAFYILQAHGLVVLARWLAAAFKLGWLQILLVGGLVALLCLPVAASLNNLYYNPAYTRDDYRGIIAYINATAGPRDAILINAPSQIETVGLYYDGPLPEYPLPLQRPLDQDKTEAALEEMVAQHPRIYGIFWATDESDPQRLIEGWLDNRCFKTLDSWFGNVRLVVYAVPQVAANESEQPTNVIWGDKIRLLGYTLLTPQPSSGEIIQLTLFWQALAPSSRRYKVFIHLVDGRGNIVGQRDSEPNGGSNPTTNWQPGEMITDNYGLLIPPGTPPGKYTLRVGWYGVDDGARLPATEGASQGNSPSGQSLGDAVDLAQITIRSAQVAPPLAALDIERADQGVWGSVQLVGHSLRRLGFEYEPALSFRPGEGARLVLFWRKEGNAPAAEQFVLALEDRRGHAVWQEPLTPLGGEYPAASWHEGEILRDIHPLFLPPVLPTGAYRLILHPAEGQLGKAYTLQQVSLKP